MTSTLKTYLLLEEIALHHEGKSTEALADTAREVMDVLWKRMTPQEWAWLNDRDNI